jgi:hypothetical protein
LPLIISFTFNNTSHLKKTKMRGRKKKHHTTHRRMGASKKNEVVMLLAGLAVGMLGGTYAAQKFVPATVDPKLVGAGELVAGGLIVTKGKSGLVKGLGLGVAAAGVSTLGRGFGIITGMGQIEDSIEYRGMGDASTIYPDLSTISGGIDGATTPFSHADLGSFPSDSELATISGVEEYEYAEDY